MANRVIACVDDNNILLIDLNGMGELCFPDRADNK